MVRIKNNGHTELMRVLMVSCNMFDFIFFTVESNGKHYTILQLLVAIFMWVTILVLSNKQECIL